MSVFGGDSWSREAQNRKRRVDDLFISSRGGGGASSADSYKKLSNGKFACLVCPDSPILDTPLMVSIHCKGSRHVAAEIWLKEHELLKSEELKKRIALSSDSDNSKMVRSHNRVVPSMLRDKPLIEQTRKAILEMQSNTVNCSNSSIKGDHMESSRGVSPFKYQSCSTLNANIEPLSNFRPNGHDISKGKSPEATEVNWKPLLEQEVDFRKRREKELKFISAGWKRDCHGKWYQDENIHCKGSRHVAAEIWLKKQELLKSGELKKRIALSSDSDNSKMVRSHNCVVPSMLRDKPLIDQTQKEILEMQSNTVNRSNSSIKGDHVESSRGVSPFKGQSCSTLNAKVEPLSNFRPNGHDISKGKSPEATEVNWKPLLEQEVDFRKRREKVLKFISAGWKRDCHGKWYQDENAEFDSDEEDPNVVLE